MRKYIAEFIGTFFLVLTVGCTVIPGATGVIPAIAIGAVLMNDVVDRLFKNDETDRTLLTGLGQTIDELASIEWLVGTIAFDDTEIGALDFFIGGIAISAL